MKTIALRDVADPMSLVGEVSRVLKGGGLVCVPCAGRYRIVADLENEAAVMRLMQAKARVKTAPALVFVDGVDQLARVADHVPERVRQLADAYWPGPLTIRVSPNDNLPRKVLKQLGGNKVRLGVRVPLDDLMLAVTSEVGSPLLVSSANRQKKAGESSPAQVRKTFANRVDLFIDAGDLQPGPKSTVVDVSGERLMVEREGAISLAAAE